MSASPLESGSHGNPPGFDSLDSIVIIIDGPGDNTIRPSRPALRQRALEFQKLLALYSKSPGQAQPPSQPQDGSDAKVDS